MFVLNFNAKVDNIIMCNRHYRLKKMKESSYFHALDDSFILLEDSFSHDGMKLLILRQKTKNTQI